MTTQCRYCRKPIDARTLKAGGEVCWECATQGPDPAPPPPVSPDADENLRNDAIQFPRLIAELEAILRPDDYVELAAVMDLTVEQVSELFERAATVWDSIKARTSRG